MCCVLIMFSSCYWISMIKWHTDNSGNFNAPSVTFIHYLFNLLSIHIFVRTVWQHNPCQLLSLGLMWPQCLIQPSSIPFHPIFLSQKPPSSAITDWPQSLAQHPQHKQGFSSCPQSQSFKYISITVLPLNTPPQHQQLPSCQTPSFYL